ncbi:glycosyltransferase family 2 protein [Peribacillus glennii]|uniref:Glycosyltransferase n=1 Tax=Peribacillus glennii TaxID=2303991 RepID=A0A372LIM7_9BACI|nr:glycosyltransferase family 2 protein [Peribacillus glennii]RFU65822.1 glycosyltransferase [Peribacillus glennii]
MEYQSLVSIIMPVYNAEKYLSKCIDSILNQSYKNLELILVNDGSKDKSGFICDEYAKNDHRITVIHQENSGPSAARNNGIKAAQGTYIQFVDSDDSMEADMTKNLVEAMNNTVQLVLCGYHSIELNDGNTTITKRVPLTQGTLQHTEFIECFGELYNNQMINPLWNKLYVKDIIKEFNISFIEELNMGEDLLFNLAYIKVCGQISVITDPLYNYIIFNNNSLTRSFKKGYFENQQMLFRQIRDLLQETNSYTGVNRDFVEATYAKSIVRCFSNLFHDGSNLTTNEQKGQISNIINDDYVRENFLYFKDGNLQKQLIGYLIQHKSINGIYYFFKLKGVTRNKIRPLFDLVKTFTSKNSSRNKVGMV